MEGFDEFSDKRETLIHMYENQYDRGLRVCALILSLYKLTGTDGQAGGQVGIWIHGHPKIILPIFYQIN